MLVVADSSPINVLVRVGYIGVLRPLFGRVLLPPQVRDELSHPRAPDSVRAFIDALPDWMEVRPARAVESIPSIEPGEQAAISLARELGADALLIDDRAGRRQAALRGVLVIGTLGVLERAAERDMVNFAQAVARLRATDMRLDPRLLQQAIDRYAARSRGLPLPPDDHGRGPQSA